MPVIACLHGFVIGGGIDLTSGADIRYASKDLKSAIIEIDIGCCADLGTMQRIGKIVGS